MATSGSYNWADSVDRNTAIEYALKRIGVIGQGETPSATQYTEASFWLNAFIKHWQADGMILWKNRFGYILPQTDDRAISLGPSGDHATLTYTKTELSAAAAAAATTITVDSITGISASDRIGIEQNDNTMHWTTVSGAPSGSTITLAAGMVSAAAIDNHVFAYTTKIQRPLKIYNAWRRIHDDVVDIPMVMDERTTYMDLGDKDVESSPIRWYYDPLLTDGVFYIHPLFTGGKDLIVISCQYPFEDLDAATDNFDFPGEWMLPVVLMLSYFLSATFGLPPEERSALFNEAMAAKVVAMGFDREEGSVRIMPDARSTAR